MIFDSCVFKDGESPLKECEDILCRRCSFEWKYPVWYGTNIVVDHCFWTKDARAGAWYDNGKKKKNSIIEAPKALRKCKNIILENVTFPNGDETLWWNEGIRIKNVKVTGDYFGMKSKDLIIDGLILKGHYSFDGCEDLLVKNSVLDTKDAFWNTENVTVYDSTINGEYLGWHSKNLRLIRCHVLGTQPLCYAQDLQMEDCTMGEDADLAFEYSEVTADIKGHIVSVKNPLTGSIKADSIGEIILDENIRQPANCKIVTTNG